MSVDDDGGLAALVVRCATAVLVGQETVTLSATGRRPPGFPRGELLSAKDDGTRNYAVDPIKALAWIYSRTRAAQKGGAA